MSHSFQSLILLLLLTGQSFLYASNVIVLPKSNTGSPVTIMNEDPWSLVASVTTIGDPIFAATNFTDTRTYLVGKSGDVAVLDNTAGFTEKTRYSVGGTVADAAMTPDGKKLLVLAGDLKVIELATDTPASIPTVIVGGSADSVAVSIDSTRAFITSSTSCTITIVDLTNNTVLAQETLNVIPNGVAVGLNGLVYVAVTNRLLEFDGQSGINYTSSNYTFDADASKPQFTPDGSRVVMLNRQAGGAVGVVVVDLKSKSITTAPVSGGGVLSQLAFLSTSRAYALGGGNSYGVLLNPASISGPRATDEKGIAVSGEIPDSRFLYSTTETMAHRTDLLTRPSLTPDVPVVNGDRIILARVPYTGEQSNIVTTTPTVVVPPSATTPPLVVMTPRIKDVVVQFTALSPGVNLLATEAVTNGDGLAAIRATMPSIPGTYIIRASIPRAYTDITVQVSSGTGGTYQFAVVGGNGQIVNGGSSSQPLQVKLSDSSGNPVSGTTINWAVRSGTGINLTNPVSTTDSQGIATLIVGTSSWVPVAAQDTVRPFTISASVTGGSIAGIQELNGVVYPSTTEPPVVELTKNVTVSGGEIVVSAGSLVSGAFSAKILTGLRAFPGLPIPNVGIRGGTPNGGPTAVCRINTVSNASGITSCDLVVGSTAGVTTLQIVVGESPAFTYSFPIRIVSNMPSTVTIVQGDGQFGPTGSLTLLPLVIQVNDGENHPLTGVAVSWAIVSGDGVLANPVNQTDGEGKASSLVRFGSAFGFITVRATVGALQATFTLRNDIPFGIVITEGNEQETGTYINFFRPLKVQAYFDSLSNPVVGQPVSFTVLSGSVTLSATTVTTDAQGFASVTARAGANPGTAQVSANLGGKVVTFNLNIAHPDRVIVLPKSSTSNPSPVTIVHVYPFWPEASVNTIGDPIFAATNFTDTRTYLVGKSGEVAVLDHTAGFTEKTRYSVGGAVADAAVTPDGKKLLVLAGDLKVIDLATDTPASIPTVDVGGSANSIAVSIDSTRAFITSSVSRTITIVDLTNNTVLAQETLSATPNGVVVNLNGLVYVAATNQLLEFDGQSGINYTSSNYTFDADAGKPQFTPDGSRVVMLNRQAGGAVGVVVVDLKSKTITTAPVPGGEVLSQLTIVSRSGAIALGDGKRYGVSLDPAGISPPTETDDKAIVASGEDPDSRYLYSTTETIATCLTRSRPIFRINTPVVNGDRIVLAPVPYAGEPSNIVTTTPTVVVPPSAMTPPLVVRTVWNSVVHFTALSPGVNLLATEAVANGNGFAAIRATMPSVPGTYVIRASVPMAYTDITVQVSSGTGGTYQFAVVGGNGQIVNGGSSSQPFQVKLSDSTGNPVSGATINWAVRYGTGITLTNPVSTTNAQGIASLVTGTSSWVPASAQDAVRPFAIAASITGGSIGGVQEVNGVVYPSTSELPVVELTKNVTVSSGEIVVSAGSLISGAFSAKILTGLTAFPGLPIPNVGIRGGTPHGGPPAICRMNTVSDASGITSCDLVVGNTAGVTTLQIVVGEFPAFTYSFPIRIISNAPSTVTILQGDGQFGPTGSLTPLPLTIQVKDGENRPLTGVGVSWAIVSGDGALVNLVNQTDGEGKASTLVRFGSAIGYITVRATVGASQVTFTLHNDIPFWFQITEGDGQSTGTYINFTTPLKVQAYFDSLSNPMVGQPVNFTVLSGSVTLSATTVITDAQGFASVTARAGANPGTAQVRADIGGKILTFNLNIVHPNRVIVLPKSNTSNPSPVAILHEYPFWPVASVTTIGDPIFAATNFTDTRTYLVGKSGDVAVLDHTAGFAEKTRYPVGGAVADATMTPDGKKLLVLAGDLKVIDLATDTPASIPTVAVGGAADSVAVSIDSTRAFITSSASRTITIVNLTNNAVLAQETLAVSPNGVTVGRNGLVYVAATNRLLEFDGQSGINYTNSNYTFDADAGKPQFTPDGSRVVMLNRQSGGAVGVVVVDLGSKSITTAPVPGGGVLSQLAFLSRTRAYALGNGKSYGVSLDPANVGEPSATDYKGIATSGEDPESRFFYSTTETVATCLTLSRPIFHIDNPVVNGDRIVFARVPYTGEPYGIGITTPNVVVPPSATTPPLVVRTGVNVMVQFTALSPGVNLLASEAVTNGNGLAAIRATMPAVPGTYSIRASIPSGAYTDITVQVSSGTTEGINIAPVGGTPQSAIVGSSFAAVLQVRVLNGTGDPLSGRNVTFTAPISGASGTFTDSSTVITDANGIATAPAITANMIAGSYTVTATVPGASAPAVFSLTNTATPPPPNPQINSILNAAGFTVGVTPNSLTSIFGTNLASWTESAKGFPMPTKLGGTTVIVIGQAVPLLYVSPTQINFQLPPGLPAPSNMEIRIIRDNFTEYVTTVRLVVNAPGLFLMQGGPRAAALNADYSLNTATNPVAPGKVVLLYGTALGPVNHEPPAGQPASADPLSQAIQPVTATIGGKPATVLFAGLAPGFASLAQINVAVPDDLVPGDYPVVIKVGDTLSNPAIISVGTSESSSTAHTN